MSLSLRPFGPADIPAGLRLCRACRWNQVEDDWRAFVDLPGAAGCLAQRDGAVTGSAAFLRYENFSWIAMMLVDPQARRAGIASRLLEWALESLRGEFPIRLDATPAGEPLYRRYGFQEEYPLVRMKAVTREGEFPSSGSRVRPMDPADLPEVCARDHAVFGADRGDLLASFFRRAPELAWLAPDGYCFGRPGYLYGQIGPLVAADAETAAALVSQCLRAKAGRQFALDVPQHSPEWLGWLESAGFAIERPFLRMTRGARRSYGLPGWQFAIAGPEFG